jgi:exopolyphosphatase/guanosine-5'-triphosphate,3'-diphosphate pyrophosphatase
MAVLLHRSRNEHAPRIERLRLGKNKIEISFTEKNLQAKRPLLVADLEREKEFLAAVNVELNF